MALAFLEDIKTCLNCRPRLLSELKNTKNFQFNPAQTTIFLGTSYLTLHSIMFLARFQVKTHWYHTMVHGEKKMTFCHCRFFQPQPVNTRCWYPKWRNVILSQESQYLRPSRLCHMILAQNHRLASGCAHKSDEIRCSQSNHYFDGQFCLWEIENLSEQHLANLSLSSFTCFSPVR